jgi:hypothetical protein
MNVDGPDSGEQLPREAVERYQEHKQKGRQLVEALVREAVEREREQKQQQRAAVEQVHREAIEQGRVQPLPPYERPTIHYTELPAPQPDSQLFHEWNLYRREVGRLLAEGQQGRFLLIKGENIIGIWDTEDEAEAVALQKYLMQPYLIHQIRSREPLVRMSARFWGCKS